MGCWVFIISLNTSNPGAKKQVVRRWGTEWVATVSVSLGHLKSVFHRIPSTALHGFYIKKPQGKIATMPLTQYIRALDSPQFKRKIANFVFSSVSQNYFFPIFSSVQSLSHVQLFATAWAAAHQASHPSPTLGVYSNSCPLSQWCYPTISPSVVPFSSCPQSYLASRSFQISQFFTSGEQVLEWGAIEGYLKELSKLWFFQ